MNISLKMKCGRWIGLVAMIVTGSIAVESSVLASPENITAAERTLLPDYCNYTQDHLQRGGGGPDWQAGNNKYRAILGDGINYLHHYCWGLVSLARADRVKYAEKYRKYSLRDFIIEAEFVVLRVPSNFKLLPEMLTRQGRAYFRLGEPAAAIPKLERAMQVRPDYWPAYQGLAQVYLAGGDKTKAKLVVEAGLVHAPDAVALLQMIKELGGSLPPQSSANSARTSGSQSGSTSTPQDQPVGASATTP